VDKQNTAAWEWQRKLEPSEMESKSKRQSNQLAWTIWSQLYLDLWTNSEYATEKTRTCLANGDLFSLFCHGRISRVSFVGWRASRFASHR
jgi:hypothetical protein